MKRRIRSGFGFFVCLVLAFSFLPSINFVSTVKAQETTSSTVWNETPSFEPYLILNYPSTDHWTWNTTFGLYTMDKAKYLMSFTDKYDLLQVSKSMFWLNTSDTTKVLNPDKILNNYVVLVQNNSCFKIRYAVTTNKDIVGWLTIEYEFFKDSNPKISVSYDNILLTSFNIVWVLLPILKYVEVSESETVDYTTADTFKLSTTKQEKRCRIGETSSPMNWSSWLSVFWDDSEGASILYAGTEKVWGGKGLTVLFPTGMISIDPTVIFTTVSVTSVHTCPLDQRTFVIAYSDDTNDDFSFQIYDTNGTQVLAETDVDTTSGGTMSTTSVGVSAFNSTTFVIGWYDYTDQDATFAVYNASGSLLSGPTDADTAVGTWGYSVQVSAFNSTYFVIGWYDYVDQDVTFAIYTSSSTLIAGPIDADATAGDSRSVSVSTFNSTTFVIGWYDRTDGDATFAVYNSAGTQIGSTVDADTDIGDSSSVSVSTLNSTYFAIGWYDNIDQDATFAVYDSSGNVKTAAIDADTDVGIYSYSVQVAALNSTAVVISWYDRTDLDLSFATYLSNGTAVAALTDIESWPTAANVPFRYQSPCSQESGTGIKLYNDNWIIAYGNTTTQAIWQAFTPSGAVWDGTIPAGGDTTMPTYSGISTNTTIRSTPCNFSVTLADETALANYTFGTNNTGAWTNESVVTISGTSYKANTTKTLNDTVGVLVQWEYWFADSSNNLNNTGLQNVTVTAYIQVDTFTSTSTSTSSVNFNRENLNPIISQPTWLSQYSLSKSLVNLFISTPTLSSVLVSSHENAYSSISTTITASVLNIAQEISTVFLSIFQPSSVLFSNRETAFPMFSSTATFSSVLGFNRENSFPSISTSTTTSLLYLAKEFGNLFISSAQPSSRIIFNNEFGFPFISQPTWNSLFTTWKDIGIPPFSSVSTFSTALDISHENLFTPISMVMTQSTLNMGQSISNNFASVFSSLSTIFTNKENLFSLSPSTSTFTSIFAASKEFGVQYTSLFTINSLFVTSKETLIQSLSYLFTSSTNPSSMLILAKEFAFQFPSSIQSTSIFSTNKERGFIYTSLINVNGLFSAYKEFGNIFTSTVQSSSMFLSHQEFTLRFPSTATFTSLFQHSSENLFPFTSTWNPTSTFNFGKELGYSFPSVPTFSSLFTSSKELALVNKELFYTFTSQPNWNSLLFPSREYISTGWPTPITGWYISPGIFNPNPILVVESYLPTILSSVKSFYAFLFMMSYPTHIQAVAAPPATSTVNVNIISVFTVPSLNYTETVTRTLNGNQSVTMDVIVPLPLTGSQTYDYHVSTIYLYGNTLIAESSMDGTLTIQSWWIWMWAGLVAGLILSFIGIVVGSYKLHERKQKNKLKLQKAQKLVRQLQRT